MDIDKLSQYVHPDVTRILEENPQLQHLLLCDNLSAVNDASDEDREKIAAQLKTLLECPRAKNKHSFDFFSKVHSVYVKMTTLKRPLEPATNDQTSAPPALHFRASMDIDKLKRPLEPATNDDRPLKFGTMAQAPLRASTINADRLAFVSVVAAFATAFPETPTNHLLRAAAERQLLLVSASMDDGRREPSF